MLEFMSAMGIYEPKEKLVIKQTLITKTGVTNVSMFSW